MELSLVSISFNVLLIFWVISKVKETTKLDAKVKSAEKETQATLKALRELERLYDEVIKELPHDVDALNTIINRMSLDKD